jgi:hypothetical protein
MKGWNSAYRGVAAAAADAAQPRQQIMKTMTPSTPQLTASRGSAQEDGGSILPCNDEVLGAQADLSEEEIFHQEIGIFLADIADLEPTLDAPKIESRIRVSGGRQIYLWDIWVALCKRFDFNSFENLPLASSIDWEGIAGEMRMRLDKPLKDTFERLWNDFIVDFADWRVNRLYAMSGGQGEDGDGKERGEEAVLVREEDVPAEDGLVVAQPPEYQDGAEEAGYDSGDSHAKKTEVGLAAYDNDTVDKGYRQVSPDLSDNGPIPSYQREWLQRDGSADNTPARGKNLNSLVPERLLDDEPAAKKRRLKEPETQDFFAPGLGGGDDSDDEDDFAPLVPRRRSLELPSLPPRRPFISATSDARHNTAGSATSIAQKQPSKEPGRRRSGLPFANALAPTNQKSPVSRPPASSQMPPPPPPPPPPRTQPPMLPQGQALPPPRTQPPPTAQIQRRRQNLPVVIVDSEDDSDEPVEMVDNMDDLDEENKELVEIVNQYRAKGFSGEMIEDALTCTTLCIGNLEAVLQHLKRGYGIPANMPGVWTVRDDEDLRLVDEKLENPRSRPDMTERQLISWKLKGLQAKHGKENVELRRNFLAAQDQDGESD